MEDEPGSKIPGDSEGVPERPLRDGSLLPRRLRDPMTRGQGREETSISRTSPSGALRLPSQGGNRGSAPEADPAVTSYHPGLIWGDETQDGGRGSRP